MRRSFGYYAAQPCEATLRASIAEVVAGFPVKCVNLQPWESGGFRVDVELDLPEEVEHVRRDVEALVRAHPRAAEVTVTDTSPFGDIFWSPFSRRDIHLGEFVEMSGAMRFAILWQLFGECRYFLGPAGLAAGSVLSLGAYPDLHAAVTSALAYVVDGIMPVRHAGTR